MEEPLTAAEQYREWAKTGEAYELRYKGHVVYDTAKQARSDVKFLADYIEIMGKMYPYTHARFFRK